MAVPSDPIADFLTRIRNSTHARRRYVDVPWSRIKENIARILMAHGYVENILVKQDENQRGTMRVFLKYTDTRKPVIQGIKRMSKPGRRQYVRHDDIPSFFGGFGLPIVSTSRGLKGGPEATADHLGGELLCLVW